MENNINIEADKPLSLVIKDFKLNLENIINNSSLPMYLVEPILKDIYNQVFILSQQETTQEINEYNSKVKKSD